MCTEKWREIPNFPGYEVSSHGNVRSTDRRDAIGRPRRGRIMRPTRDRGGYFRVGLRRENARHTRSVHQLVLEAFIGPRPKFCEARHLDGDPGNNRTENLAWGTSRENSDDKRRHGTEKNGNVDKSRCPRGHELKSPNLIPSQLKRGKRSCLACEKAYGFVRFNPAHRKSKQIIADEIYEEIMASARR